MLTILSTSPFLTSLSLTLLHFIWQGVLVAAVLKSALLIFNNNKPQLRYALSALAMVANFILPLITFAIIYQTENYFTSSLALNEFIQELKQPNTLYSYRELAALLPSLLPYLAIAWLAAIFLLSGKLLVQIYSINNLPKQSTVAPSQLLQARFNELAKQIKLSIAPQLLISLKVDVPMAIGWLKPVVLIPANMVSGLSTPQLEMLILHELAHIRRHDYLVNFFQTLVEILLFFHPAVHWVSKQMRNEREYCSDDIAVKHCGDAIAYAHTLTDTASLCAKAHHHTIPELAVAASGGDLKQRVVRLVDHHCAPKNNISKWFASVTIVFSVLLLSSKQLLTMPLLDIWHNEESSHQLNNDDTQLQAVTNTKKEIPNSSIAQQLLTSHSKLKITTDEKLKQQAESQVSFTPSQQVDVTEKVQLTRLIASLENASVVQQASSPQAGLQTSTPKVITKKEKLTNIAKKPAIKAKFSQPQIKATAPLIQPKRLKEVKTENSESLAVLATNSPNTTSKKDDLAYLKEMKRINTNFVDHISRQKDEWVQPIAITNKSIVPISPVWKSAEQVKSVVPIYPSIAKRRGIEIEIKVDFTIDIDGQIKDIRFAQHKKINYFESSIRKAIKKWRFVPAKVDEKPVESQMAKVFSFSLDS